MFAVMLLLGILGSVLMNTDHVLTKNPCSIAAVASLLADSNLIGLHEMQIMHCNEKSFNASFLASVPLI